jgi:hypothetical protein
MKSTAFSGILWMVQDSVNMNILGVNACFLVLLSLLSLYIFSLSLSFPVHRPYTLIVETLLTEIQKTRNLQRLHNMCVYGRNGQAAFFYFLLTICVTGPPTVSSLIPLFLYLEMLVVHSHTMCGRKWTLIAALFFYLCTAGPRSGVLQGQAYKRQRSRPCEDIRQAAFTLTIYLSNEARLKELINFFYIFSLEVWPHER